MNSVCKWGAAGCPPCLCPSLPTCKYLHPGSCTCYNWLGRLGRLVTPLPNVRDTHQVSPRSWKNHLSKVGMTEFSFWLLEINTKESERPPGRDQQECTKPDLQKKSPFVSAPLQNFSGEGGWEPPLFTSWESWAARQRMGAVGDQTHPGFFSWSSTVFTLLSFLKTDFLQHQNLFNHISPTPLPCIPFSLADSPIS